MPYRASQRGPPLLGTNLDDYDKPDEELPLEAPDVLTADQIRQAQRRFWDDVDQLVLYHKVPYLFLAPEDLRFVCLLGPFHNQTSRLLPQDHTFIRMQDVRALQDHIGPGGNLHNCAWEVDGMDAASSRGAQMVEIFRFRSLRVTVRMDPGSPPMDVGTEDVISMARQCLQTHRGQPNGVIKSFCGELTPVLRVGGGAADLPQRATTTWALLPVPEEQLRRAVNARRARLDNAVWGSLRGAFARQQEAENRRRVHDSRGRLSHLRDDRREDTDTYRSLRDEHYHARPPVAYGVGHHHTPAALTYDDSSHGARVPVHRQAPSSTPSIASPPPPSDQSRSDAELSEYEEVELQPSPCRTVGPRRRAVRQPDPQRAQIVSTADSESEGVTSLDAQSTYTEDTYTEESSRAYPNETLDHLGQPWSPPLEENPYFVPMDSPSHIRQRYG